MRIKSFRVNYPQLTHLLMVLKRVTCFDMNPFKLDIGKL